MHPRDRLGQVLDGREMARVRPERRDGVHRRFAQGEHAGDAALLRVAPDFAVEVRAFVADLAHVAEDEQGAAARPRQHVDRRADGVRIGVVGVVDHSHALAGLLDLQAAGIRAESR